MSEPTREELIQALNVMWHAHSSKTTRDALSYIGLGIDCTFPCAKGIQSVSQARDVLQRALPADSKPLQPIHLPAAVN